MIEVPLREGRSRCGWSSFENPNGKKFGLKEDLFMLKVKSELGRNMKRLGNPLRSKFNVVKHNLRTPALAYAGNSMKFIYLIF